MLVSPTPEDSLNELVIEFGGEKSCRASVKGSPIVACVQNGRPPRVFIEVGNRKQLCLRVGERDFPLFFSCSFPSALRARFVVPEGVLYLTWK